jgi:hypothetical protein
MVTIFSDKVPVVCVHPYPIDTQEADVLRDPQKNSLYFPITREEIFSGLRRYRYKQIPQFHVLLIYDFIF